MSSKTETHSKKKFLIILYFLETLTLFLGISLPLVQIDELWFFSSEFSLLSISVALFKAGELLLSFLLIFFGFFIPIIKILARSLGWLSIEPYNLQKLNNQQGV